MALWRSQHNSKLWLIESRGIACVVGIIIGVLRLNFVMIRKDFAQEFNFVLHDKLDWGKEAAA